MSRHLPHSPAAMWAKLLSPGRREQRYYYFYIPCEFVFYMSLCLKTYHSMPLTKRVLFLQIASDGLKGRVFEVSLADLQSVSYHTCNIVNVTFTGRTKKVAETLAELRGELK